MIGVLVGFGGKLQLYPLAKALAWGSVAGSALQFGAQLPTVFRLAGRFRFQIETISSNTRTIIRNFVPGMASRGVNQLSSYIDLWLAGFLPDGSVANLMYAQTIYLLPISLFGMSISNAELPEMSSQLGSEDSIVAALGQRLNGAMQRIAFFVVPSVAGFLVLGESVVALLYQTGKFTHDNVLFVWAVLAGSTVGLLASTLGRLYTSAFWALRDTGTPLRFASLRVGLTAGLGWFLTFPVPAWLGIPPRQGLIGLTVSAGMAAWIEFTLLRSALNRRIGKTGLRVSYLAKLWIAALVAAGIAFVFKTQINIVSPLISSGLVLSVYGLLYMGGATVIGIPEALNLVKVLRTRLRGRI
jgi:putative peptidoglycan lipid II flippase